MFAAHDDAPFRASLWHATSAEPAPDTPPLEGEVRADVAVVGAGYTGLSAALHLAEAGTRVIVLEAKEPGWGASGRNGGQVIPGLKHEPAALEAMFGPEIGGRLADIGGGAPDFLFALIRRFDIRCDAHQQGWIQPAHAAPALRLVEDRVAQWRARGVDAELLDRDQVAARLGTDIYVGGWLDPRGGGVQPLAYARGLARAALDASATIHGGSPVRGLMRGAEGWRLATPRGAVIADTVLLCTNAYSGDLWPGLRQSLVPLRPFQVASAPLGQNLRRTILPGGQVASDTRRHLAYYRIDPAGRLLMGGDVTFDHAPRTDVHARIRRRAAALFPQIGEPAWEYAWSGWVAITPDHMPHLHALAPGLYAGVGFQGRGVAMGTMMGKQLALHALGGEGARAAWPSVPLRPVPFHGLRGPAARALWRWYGLRDRMELWAN